MNAVSGNEMLAQFSGTAKGQNVGLAMQSLVESNAVCFDVDSTVITEEGIDVLAAHLGKGKQVADLTAAAMEGGMKFQDALQQRLDLLQPSRQQIQECLKQHPFEFSPSVVAFVRKLQELNKHVYLVSGGFRIMIEPVAERLGIPCSNIFANTIIFDDESGAYTGFDPTEPTSRDMGKPKAVQAIIDKGNYETVVMIGDGATDAQAKPPAAAFIGFGGVAVRDKVRATADWFVTDFADCLAILEKYDGRAR
jgi:phosphoserine phosphatase